VAEVGVPLEATKADVRVAEADEDGGSRRGGLIVAIKGLAGLEEAPCLGCVDAERLEHFGGEHLADAAFEGEAAVTAA
jgi:hypothetical protein